MSAVSSNVMPSSSAASTTARVRSRSTRPPKLLQPSPTTETVSPEAPSWRYSIGKRPSIDGPGEPTVREDAADPLTLGGPGVAPVEGGVAEGEEAAVGRAEPVALAGG